MTFWDPLLGCTPVSEGCRYCSSARAVDEELITWRDGLPHFCGKVKWDESAYEDAEFYPENSQVFVCGRSDLFHEAVSDEIILRIIEAGRLRPDCLFFVITKRPERLHEICSRIDVPVNFWLGITVENQRVIDRLKCFEGVRATRVVSAKPLLSNIDFSPYMNLFDMIIVGGEYNYLDLDRSRPMSLNWARSIRDTCVKHNKPFSFHNWGSWIPCSEKESTRVVDGHFMKHHDNSEGAYLLDGVSWDQYPQS
jgi:protein gp37